MTPMWLRFSQRDFNANNAPNEINGRSNKAVFTWSVNLSVGALESVFNPF